MANKFISSLIVKEDTVILPLSEPFKEESVSKMRISLFLIAIILSTTAVHSQMASLFSSLFGGEGRGEGRAEGAGQEGAGQEGAGQEGQAHTSPMLKIIELTAMHSLNPKTFLPSLAQNLFVNGKFDFILYTTRSRIPLNIGMLEPAEFLFIKFEI